MKKIFLILFFIFSFISKSFSQTYIKMNGTYALFAIPSIGVEVGIAPKATFQLDATMSFWNSINDRPWVFNQIFPEIRYYFKDKNDGFYSGVHVGYGMFKLSKNSSYAQKNQYQYGYIWFTGATIGYQWKVKENWLLDLFLGGGWSKANYEGFDKDLGSARYELGSGINYSAQSIPYRGGLMIGYKF